MEVKCFINAFNNVKVDSMKCRGVSFSIRSDRVLKSESDFENLSVVGFDESSKFFQLLVFLLSTSGILLLAVVGELVDLEGVVHILGILSLSLEALDLAGTYLETISGHAHSGSCLSRLSLHS